MGTTTAAPASYFVTRNRFTPNFRGGGLDENLKPKSPPSRGAHIEVRRQDKMRLASRLVPPPPAAHPPRSLLPALRSRCAPCSRSSHDCARISLIVEQPQPRFIRMKSTSKKRPPSIVNLTVKRRYLTQREIERLMDCARKHGRYGHRDATMILVAYRHGLRASEVCDLQWQQIELSEGRLHVHRVKKRDSQRAPNPR